MTRNLSKDGRRLACIKSTYSLAVCIFLLAASVAHTDSLRCAYDIVSTGDSKSVVSLKCGQPHWREPLGSVTRGAYQSGKVLIAPGRQPKGTPAPGHDRKAGVFAEQTLSLEKWYYDCGSDVFVHAITFEGDLATKIESISQRGSGDHNCQP